MNAITLEKLEDLEWEVGTRGLQAWLVWWASVSSRETHSQANKNEEEIRELMPSALYSSPQPRFLPCMYVCINFYDMLS